VTGRLVIEDLRPRTPSPGHFAKAVVGEAVRVTAVVFKEGHDRLDGRVRLVARGQKQPQQHQPQSANKSEARDQSETQEIAELIPLGNDEWESTVVPRKIGPHWFVVEAWTDRYATWAHKVTAKLDAGQGIAVEILEGRELLRRGVFDPAVAAALRALDDPDLDEAFRVGPALGAGVATALRGPEGADDLTVSAPQPLWVDRELALFGAWYELFPRSFGGLKATAARAAEVAAMGFDVLYLPPIHPIGQTDRKGPNNTLIAGDDDPGSPWAIGSRDGGHTAIHPDLGTLEDFHHLVAEVRAHGMELALDYALQCSPDHPWVTDHPEWFHRRPDGTIAHAENPPKVYQDIVPINFWPATEPDRIALWEACREIMRYWIAQGVAVFRVDNPHTKPIEFWEWLISSIQEEHPDVILLSEAFTRPRIMARLAEAGFTQSYTYFTWRIYQHGPEGLWAYVDELAHGPLADYMRPNFWPNTPDILSGPLRLGPPSAFALRLVLAATLSPSYGVYSGYELYENLPASDQNEEYLHSEKYEIKDRDYSRPDSLAPLMVALNDIRRRHPALHRLRSIRFHPTNNPAIIAYSKMSDDRSDAVLMVVNLDPDWTQEATLQLDLTGMGLPDDRPYPIFDELSGEHYHWRGRTPYVRLDPAYRVAHVFDLSEAR
jgi:starch synthase (maltosyl-transferring)